MNDAITIEGLEKIYRSGRGGGEDVHALKPLHLHVQPGEVFGLLGPNGAGKTTLVKLLLGIVHPTSGRASIMGRPIGTTISKQLVGYLPENHRYPQYLSGGGVLSYFGRLSGMNRRTIAERTQKLLAMVNMTRWRGMKVRKYSKGMMQRLGLAQALLNEPKVVFLDEPTDGVDPVGRREIRELIAGLRAAGTTVFLNSHLLSEVELISDRVAILHHGAMVRLGTVRELTEHAQLYRMEIAGEHADRIAGTFQPFAIHEQTGTSVTLRAESLADLNAVIDHVRSQGLMIVSLQPKRQTLEELFLDIVQQGGAAS